MGRAEEMVLDGAEGTLRDFPPSYWIIETKPNGPVIARLQEFGYRSEILETAGGLFEYLVHSSLYTLPSLNVG